MIVDPQQHLWRISFYEALYTAKEDRHKAHKRWKEAKQSKIERISELQTNILSLLAQGYSAELIAYILKTGRGV
ncbi:MAG: hypothetical protein N3F66_12500 [Spirochaetes bacterium]|nr:hypothetical protein [Spirochaetota bacterium]